MATTIITKNGSGAPAAGDLTAGELAVDLTNKRLYSKDSGGTVIELGTNPGSSGGTISGATIDNSVIGGTTPAAGTFTTLTATAASTITTADNNPQLTLISTDADASEGPVLKLYRNSGSPADNDILGRIQFSGEDDAGNDSTFGRIDVVATDVSNNSEDARMEFSPAVGDAFTPTMSLTGGNVGINTTSPDQELHVKGSGTVAKFEGTGGSGFIQITDSDDATSAFIGVDAGALKIQTSGSSYSDKIVVDTSGNVGIGTSSPNQLLTLGSGSGSATIGLDFETTNTTRGSILYNAGTGEMAFTSGYSGYGGFMTFDCNGAERMRIDGSGNLLLGRTSGTNRRLYLSASSNTSSVYACQMENSDGDNLFFVRSDGAFNTGEDASSPYNNTSSTAANLVVNSSGFLERSTSSARYKENIRDYDQSISIDALRPVFFNSKKEDDDKTYAGLIAEEVHEAGFTEFVEYNKDGEPDAVFYANMVALCIKEIQDLKAEVAALKGSN